MNEIYLHKFGLTIATNGYIPKCVIVQIIDNSNLFYRVRNPLILDGEIFTISRKYVKIFDEEAEIDLYRTLFE